MITQTQGPKFDSAVSKFTAMIQELVQKDDTATTPLQPQQQAEEDGESEPESEAGEEEVTGGPGAAVVTASDQGEGEGEATPPQRPPQQRQRCWRCAIM